MSTTSRVKDNNGYLDYSDICGIWNAKKHPEVVDGRRTEQDVLEEFLHTFEQHKSLNPDGKVTLEEWTEYYALFYSIT